MASEHEHHRIDSHDSVIQKFRDLIAGKYGPVDDATLAKAKEALKRHLFESQTPGGTVATTHSEDDEILKRIDAFLEQKEKEDAQKAAEEKARQEAILKSERANPKHFKETDFDLHAKSPDEVLKNIDELNLQEVENARSAAEREAIIQSNIDAHLQMQEELETKKREKEEKLKAAAKASDVGIGGNFANTRRRHHDASFAKISDDITQQNWLKQTIVISDYIYVPEGMEAFFLGAYFLIFPYVTGLIVLFFFVAQRDISNFLVFDIFTLIPVWAIGYETLAAIIMTLIIRSGVSFYLRKKKALKKKEKAIRAKVRRMEKSKTKFNS